MVIFVDALTEVEDGDDNIGYAQVIVLPDGDIIMINTKEEFQYAKNGNHGL